MTELIQKKLFQSKEYRIQDEEVFIKIKTQSEQNEWHCSLEELGLKKLYKKQPKTVKNITVAVCFSIVIAVIFTYLFYPEQMELRAFQANLFCWSVLGIIFLAIPTKNELHLYGGSQDLSFFRDIPDADSVDEFVDELISKTKIFLRKKYAKVDKDLNQEMQIANFDWLKNIGVISEQEFESLKEEVKREQLF